MSYTPKYTYDQMLQFYKIYSGKEGNRNRFIEKLKEYNITEEESCIMWQSFDIAYEFTDDFVEKY